ncbi:MAG: hypothetical protein QNJ46_12750 [Leptolyngbyaceae cyanobacterium MO_188.B28]|nr:hypothetical protein [Leptolyngbyaceae cyanobacterium MO_188.B28]
MVDSVLSKLLAADSDLEAQETKLVAQLEAIQAKRNSLQSVMGIFEPDKAAIAVSPTVKTEEAEPAQAPEAAVTPPTEKPKKAASKPSAKPTKDKAAQPSKTRASSRAVRRGWQKYVRKEHGATPLPEIVARILESKPKKSFEIAEVIDQIVAPDIPDTPRKEARNRISNILAEGARKKQWYRPKGGFYRLSR